MSWDDVKVDNVDGLSATEWNTHVTDQKTRAVRGMTLVANALVFADASEQLMTGAAAKLIWDNTNNCLGIGTAAPADPLVIIGANDSTPILSIGTGAGTQYEFSRNLSTGALYIQGQQAGYNNIFLAPTSGNVGIGGTTATSPLYVTGNAYFTADVSALTFTDRTPFYDGNALTELKAIKSIDRKIDHSSLPIFAQKRIITINEDKTENIENGRDLGAMISILTKAVQQLTEKVEKLEMEIIK